MTTPLGDPGFPNEQATVFVREFRVTVAPTYENRAKLATSPPLFLLRVPRASYRTGVDRVVAALAGALRQRVPFAHLPAGTGEGADARLLSAGAGTQLSRSAPQHMTPDRFPHFHVMCDLVGYIRSHPQEWADNGNQEAELRAHAGERRAHRGGALAFTRMEGPALDGLAGFLAGLSWLSFVQLLPRRIWARHISRKVMRAWLGAEPVAQGSNNLFRVMDHLAAERSVQLVDDAAHEETLQEFDWLLLRALLEDLRRPAIGRVLPGRRRRTSRPVLFLELPPAGEPGARAAERFLRSLRRARATAGPPGPLVVAVGVPSDALLRELGDPAESTFPEASVHLAADGTAGEPPVLVTVSGADLAARGVPVLPVDPKTFRFSRYVPATIVSGVTTLALLTTGLLLRPVVFPPPRDCLGGTGSVAESAPTEPVPVQATAWYEAAVRTIDQQNARVEQYAAQGRRVRTVVAFVSDPPTTDDETRFDGTIPELRGIAMWQERLIREAAADDSLIPLRVDVREAGVAFHDAEREADKLVAEVADEKSVPASDRVVGVLGFAQSRTETQAALQDLGDAGIPTIGTTATADEMLTGSAALTYWPSTPFNSREARIEADFARTENIVAEPGFEDRCVPAEHAIVIESSADLYSHSLARRFVGDFDGTHQVFDFDQEGRFGSTPLSGAVSEHGAASLARALCDALEDEPDSVVYWSARAKDFTALINSMDTAGTCTSRDVTVLGGNELTNVAQTGAFANKDWLRLYYSAHRLPTDDPGASDRTRQFVADYDAFVKATTAGTDPWRQDGHSAVSYDAFHVLSQAVRQAGLADPDIERKSVLLVLQAGIAFNGATGYVSYDGANAPPRDKTLVLLRQTGDRPKAVLACGAYDQHRSSEAQGPPCAG
ncbi:ABC transporter substrate-binding protein [Streptomyces dangxiongensis]|uniref:ABC transporter substrate-binding protein n=1 Tax=Streptomyces dangxiongensis TaxID=1442032 RepID=A0A3G2JG06_9ACTN|nr:ABC transporter substrate-binding protein [Streptomyces dangxiongensis]AYN40305.1 ABC transporter substrate-binding protein [Streptomyces dangxiongensis]